MDFAQLLGPTSTMLSPWADCQRSMNCYLERIESGAGRAPYALYKHFGLRPFFQPSALKQTTRGLLLDPTNEHLFAVIDDTIYDVVQNTLHLSYAPLSDNGKPVSMAESQNTLFVVSNDILYRVNSAALTTPAMPATVVPAAVGVIADLVVIIAKNTNRLYWSEDDGATWGAADFQVIQAFPNRLVNLLIDHQELWLFGNRHTQVFIVGDDPDAPFVAVTAGMIEMGLVGKYGAVRMDNSIFFLGRNKDGECVFYRANGYTPAIVSTHAVANKFRSYGDCSDVIASPYQLNGHSCIRLTFPSANSGLGASLEYDASLPPELAWREIGWWNWQQGYYERHRAAHYVSAFGKIICGDRRNGWLHELTPDEYTDYGYPLRWFRRAPHLTKENKEVKYKKFEVIAQPGVGLNTPLWLHSYNRDRATFVTDLAAQVSAGNVTAAQSTILQLIYDGLPYTPPGTYPAVDVMIDNLGFYPWGTYATAAVAGLRGGPPQLEMRYSNHGGEEASFTPYYSKSMGMAGKFNTRLQWWHLGKARDRVWEIAGDGPVLYAILNGVFDAEVCNS